MNPELSVPEAPKAQVVIPDTVIQKLDEWCSFFQKMSPRIRTVDFGDDRFETWHTIALTNLKKNMGGGYSAPSFPKLNEIAFFVAINSAMDDITEDLDIKDAWIFVFGDLALQIHHFEWDGMDAETGESKTTFSFDWSKRDRLTWMSASIAIANRLKKIDEAVPPPPQST